MQFMSFVEIKPKILKMKITCNVQLHYTVEFLSLVLTLMEKYR